jgi:copper chaperone NosL
MSKLLRLSALGFLLAVTACGESTVATAPQPREPDAHAIGFYCRMTLGEHAGPRGQILPKGWADPLWFTSVRDAFTYVEQDLVSEQEMAGFWVNDMAQGTWEKPASGSWIDARTAWYVVGSSRTAAMGGAEAVPFKERSAADDFMARHGGQVADYASALGHVAETPADPTESGATQ